ncbi:glutathione S-transferase [Ralstonia sp. SET104]|nr:glutathione S-transferase [Ralstonia sp. SET104]
MPAWLRKTHHADESVTLTRLYAAFNPHPMSNPMSDLLSHHNALPLLYSYRRCPYAMRARLAMLQANRRFQTFEIVMRDKPAALLALSPKGTVPVLLLPDGNVLEESLDIMRWAFEAPDAEGWWRRAQSDDNLALLRINDGDFKRQLDRYKYPDRYPHEATPRETARTQAMETLLMPLESRLQHQRYLGGPTPCATDLAIFPFVRQFAAVAPEWFASQPLPALQAWLAGWLGSHLFMVCMTRQPVQAIAVFPEYQRLD